MDTQGLIAPPRCQFITRMRKEIPMPLEMHTAGAEVTNEIAISFVMRSMYSVVGLICKVIVAFFPN